MMYADVVMEKSKGLIIPKGSLSIRQELELIMEDIKILILRTKRVLDNVRGYL